MRILLVIFLLGTFPITGVTAEATKPGASKPSAGAPPPPALPKSETTPSPATQPDPNLEPEVTITTRGDVTYQEYRANGKLYMVKVTPKQGKPYYLIDKEGSGQFRRSDIEPTISIPNWVIKSW